MSMISLDTAAQVMREEMRRTVKQYSLWYLVQVGLMILAGILALVYPSISSVAVVFFIGWLLIQRHLPGHQPHRRAPSTALLATAHIGGIVHRRRCAFPPQSGREFTHAHAAADRVLLDRRHFKGHFRADDTALPELGLGPPERDRRDCAGFLSVGQHSGFGGVAPWCAARDRTDL